LVSSPKILSARTKTLYEPSGTWEPLPKLKPVSLALIG
jgi:hypothetical protein